MEFSKIIAVSGKPGLFEILSQTKSGVIVKSLLDEKRMPITATHNVSLLENIAIFTYADDIPLADVFKNIADKEDGKEACTIQFCRFERGQITHPDQDEPRPYLSKSDRVFRIQLIRIDADQAGSLNAVKRLPQGDRRRRHPAQTVFEADRHRTGF